MTSQAATIILSVSLLPAVIGLVQVFTSAGMPTRFAPLAAVLLGVAGALAEYFGHDYAWVQYVIAGTTMGLGAVGVHTTASIVGIKSVLLDKQTPALPPAQWTTGTVNTSERFPQGEPASQPPTSPLNP